MNKKIKNILLAFFIMITLSGCVKFNANMNIKKDKSMDFEMIYAVDTTYFGNEALFDENEKKEMEDSGFTITDYSEGNMKGITISKKIKNIDEVSTTEDAEFSLTSITDPENSKEYLFKVKKGLLKNTYTATLKFDSSDSELSDSTSTTDETTLNLEENTTDIDTNEENDITTYDNSNSDTSNSDLDFSGMSNMDLSFNVTLPYAAISNNATEITDEGKNLKWELTTNSVNTMDFEFELYNMTNIYIGIGVIALLIIIIIRSIIKKKKRRKNKTAVNDDVQVSNENNITQNISNPNLQENSTTNIENQTMQSQVITDTTLQQSTPITESQPEMIIPTQPEIPMGQQPEVNLNSTLQDSMSPQQSTPIPELQPEMIVPTQPEMSMGQPEMIVPTQPEISVIQPQPTPQINSVPQNTTSGLEFTMEQSQPVPQNNTVTQSQDNNQTLFSQNNESMNQNPNQ